MAQKNIYFKAYEDLFDPRSGGFETLLNEAIPPYNELWYKKYFPKAPEARPIDAEGKAYFKAVEIEESSEPMMLPRAPFSPPKEGSKEGFSFYLDSLWDFGFSFSITASDRLRYEKMATEMGAKEGGEALMKRYLHNVTDLIKGANASYSNICAQILSKGEWKYQTPTGIQALGKCKEIDPSFKITATTLPWSDPNATIIEDLQKAVELIREKTRYDGMLTAKMSLNTFKLVQNNKAVREAVATTIVLGGTAVQSHEIVTIDKFNQYVSDNSNYLPIIELVEEKQILQDSTVFRKTVNGWQDEMVIVSPAGIQGFMEYAYTEELMVFRNLPNRNVQWIDGGLFGLMNWKSSLDNRQPIDITEILATGAPSLRVFKKWVQIDTSKVV